MEFELRAALTRDTGAIAQLIAESARGLGSPFYSPRQIEMALQSAFGVDSQLIEDGTYFVAMRKGSIAGCGGWSYRATLFGSDRQVGRSASAVDPRSGAAKIRAFFILPAFARRGVGSLILHRCEMEAWRKGFRRLELMATLSGLAFYTWHGYVAANPIQHELGNGLTIEFVPMSKILQERP
jgi:GNAT superfamily N-acetyltransferase